MANETTTYNGYTNYGTWALCLWIDNEQSICEYWQAFGRDHPNELADALKEEFCDQAPTLQGVYADLMLAALSEIDWQGAAEHYLPEIHEIPEIHEGETSSGSCKLEDIVTGIEDLLPEELLDEFNLYDDSPDDEATRAGIFEEICDHLNDIAPEGLEFGAHPDDGACFGFWKTAGED